MTHDSGHTRFTRQLPQQRYGVFASKIRFKPGAAQAQPLLCRPAQLHQPPFQTENHTQPRCRQSDRSQHKPKGPPTVPFILLHTVHPFLPYPALWLYYTEFDKICQWVFPKILTGKFR